MCLLADFYPYKEIIVVDNCSTDGTKEMLKDEFSQYREIKVFSTGKNIGVGARNIFLFNAKGKYVFQYDDDSQPQDNFTITRIVEFLERNNEINVLCTKVVDFCDNFIETKDWELFAWSGDAEKGFLGHFIHGSGTVFRRNALKKISGYPDNFFWGFEEADLTLQFLRAGCNIVYKPDLITLHRRKSRQFASSQITFYFVRNGILVFWKYFPFPYDLLLIIGWLFSQLLRNPNHLRDLGHGLSAGIKMLRGTRKETLRFRSIKRGIILWCIHTLLPPRAWKVLRLVKRNPGG